MRTIPIDLPSLVTEAPLRRRAAPRPAEIVARVVLGVAGGWAFVAGFVTLAIAAQVALGQRYDEAHVAAMLLAFLVFLVVLCWAIAANSLLRVAVLLPGGAAVMAGAGWLLQSRLV